jgi:site-specific DNA-methyltransferase (adenine-specific)
MSPTPITRNTLFYGDNLAILRDHIPSESVDLIYLDPPFNSNRSYNVLFKDESGTSAESQIQAFDDTWHWGPSAEETYDQLIQGDNPAVASMIGAMRQFIGANQMMAYLVMMAARLVELHRVLKPTGSLYLHCDPTASHYLKIVLDTIFSVENFKNEVIWKRTTSKSLMTKKLSYDHDIILTYQKSENSHWNNDALFQPYDLDDLDSKTLSKYSHKDENGRLYRLDNLINPNPDRPNLTYEFLGIKKVWRWTKDRMQAAYEAGLVIQTRPGAVPSYKRYLDEQRGKPIGDVWTDIFPINSQAAERLGYPTQKPLALLERIIEMSTSKGDIVLDPFSGCGTAITAAEKLGRHWIGIDITHLAISMHKNRLKEHFNLEPGKDYAVLGEPEDLAGAHQLAKDDRYQFQWWALSLIKARPLGGLDGSKEGKKGSDKGIDGIITFMDDAKKSVKRVIVSVKSGHVNSPMIRDLHGVIDREQDAPIGVFITLEPPTTEMIKEAITAGYYTSPLWNQKYQRVQILTIENLLNGAEVKMPPAFGTFKQAERIKKDDGVQPELGLE